MTETIKLLSNTITVNSTPSTIFNAKAVCLTNNTASRVLVTHHDVAANVQVGDMVLPAGSMVRLIKNPTDTLVSNSDIAGVAVAFTN